MRLKKITLKNYRCFQNLELELHPRLTVLVGENGAGKTAVLDGIAAGLSPVLKYLSSANQRLLAKGAGIKDTDFRLEKWEKPGGKENWISSDYAQVILETTGGLSWDYWRPSTAGKGKKPSTSIGEVELASHLTKISDSFKTSEPELLPVFSYYGAQRGYIKVPERVRLPNENYAHPTSALIKALDSLRDFKELLNWFYIEESDELRVNKGWEPQDHSQSVVLEAVRFAVLVLLGGAYKNPHFSNNRKFVVESSDTGAFLQVPQLSQGYQSMLALGMDFARRLTLANSHLTEESDKSDEFPIFPINELFSKLVNDAVDLGWKMPSEYESFPPSQLFAPAIMLVDEIDLHLHPTWQQLVLGDLMRAFPGTQFIVTTHSPQVLTTVRKENIRIIRQTEGDYLAETPTISPLAREAGDALAYIQGTNVRPPLEILDKIYKYEQLVRGGLMDSERGCEVKAELDQAGYEIPEADLALWQLLGQQAGKIKL